MRTHFINIFQENDEASIITPTNISVATQLNKLVIQQEEIHTQTEVQLYLSKNIMSRRVIDETTLRTYVPTHVDKNSTVHTNATTSPGHLHLDTLLSQTEATDSIDPLRFLSTHSPSIYSMTTQVYLEK